MRPHRLHRIFEPRSVALIGASPRENSVGYQVLRNILDAGFSGAVYPVNRNHESILDRQCYPSIRDVGEPVDLVVMAIPAQRIPEVMRECVDSRVGGVVVISAGFGEVGPFGQQLQDEIVALARGADIPLVGPNCLGVIRPTAGLNATFAHSGVRPGQVALVSQSGAFCTALMDAAESGGRGFSAVASLGATADVGFGQVLDYLSVDARTRSILLYIEGISDPRAFLSGLRAAARLKPVIVVKPGRHEAGRRAAVTHTGGHFGSDEVFNAALERAGAVRVLTANELFAAANILSSKVRVTGRRLAIITNGGGPGVMAADRADELDVPLATLSAESIDALSAVLPAHWSHTHPIDLLGDADSARYEQAVRIVLADRNVDGLLVLLTPQGMTEPTACAEGLVEAARGARKPVLACWLGQNQVREGRARLEAAGIPHFNSPEAGVNGFGYLAAYRRNQDKLMQAPPPLSSHRPPRVQAARAILGTAMAESRRALDGVEARELLAAFHIPVATCVNARDPEQARAEAEAMGLPVVMKINSPDISHKSDVGGVRLNVREAASVPIVYREIVAAVAAGAPAARIRGVTLERMAERPHAREVVVGIDRDPVFGPVIRFGTGGMAMDIYADTQVALPPLNVFLCEDLIHRTRANRALRGFRHLPGADVQGLVDILMRASEMACELPEIEQLIINPVLADEHGVLAVDAWVAVSAPARTGARYAHMAIHPYPPGLEYSLNTRDGRPLSVRPIRPEDAAIEQRFVDGLSPQSKYFRFMYGMGHITPAMLARFTQIDYDREMALVAVDGDGTAEASLKAVARYVANPGGDSCEFALAVADEMQRQGIGSQLMQRLMALAREHGFREIEGEVLAENAKMLQLCRRLGFSIHRSAQDAEVMAVRRAL
ncbi:bifunctional acetyl coenzyme A synthetase (ADP forming), alpha domain/GNAT family N-acetyltransferase [Parahaliea mediterranea]|uniref:GNAT family N-acetyltransferase n=1 Tax=Parahaliea mediterranea TaxID=651086 RepID=A0A939DBX4_9GAMM|nr:bifunctional acetyl coenzyme A synthetase (ADP forming), alpha domain/GNAT family N-acetyltransferase [Parahaliea mediterranea]MBN7795235.1 GNAT family N-acetyltransferase [Parahaliea mediterranea]